MRKKVNFDKKLHSFLHSKLYFFKNSKNILLKQHIVQIIFLCSNKIYTFMIDIMYSPLQQ